MMMNDQDLEQVNGGFISFYNKSKKTIMDLAEKSLNSQTTVHEEADGSGGVSGSW